MPGTTELDALVVRNIGDIEAAMKHAIYELGPRVWAEAGRTVKAACQDETWIAVDNADEKDVWFAQRSWLAPDRQPPFAEFWLGLGERIKGGSEGEQSWLATFVSSGPNGAPMAFWVDQRVLLKGAWKKLLKTSGETITPLLKLGFILDENDDRRLCLPVILDRELLAKAFEEDDFDKMMEPLSIAVQTIVSAKHYLGQRHELARGHAAAA